MKTVLILKGSRLVSINNKVVVLDAIAETKTQIKKLLNLNRMPYYTKLKMPESGDFVTCCNNKEALKKDDSGEDRANSGDYKLGITFKVDYSCKISDTLGVYGEDSKQEYIGVYLESIREATEEEISKFKESYEKRKN